MASINELPNPPSDTISSVVFSPDSNKLIVGSWDSGIHVYSNEGSGFQLSKKIECDAPVLGLAWNPDNNTIYSSGLDHEVAKYSIEQGEESRTVLSSHSQAANKVAYSKELDLVISTSWDGTMNVQDPNTTSYVSVKLDAKPFALSVTHDSALVVMAERKLHVFKLQALKQLLEQAGSTADEQAPIHAEPWQHRESSLKFMTRDVACMPDGTGFAASSIEGRVSVEFFDEEQNKNTYAFKCHREKTTVTSAGENGGEEEKTVDIVYPVNAVAFHPSHGSFATGGGDGIVALWDAKNKRRIRAYPKLAASVATLDFSADGRRLAIGVSPGFEDGREEEEPDPSLVKVYVRELEEGETKAKAPKAK
ncbi:mitotic checkpoint BUB3 [Lecanosticta acicola]|uniref:Mitotic checkpoint BUB3 n=1 Tax=Lecanosticta acicola TaxID=111012 RepID=A0AAI8YU91_9PEZI|nr:mitotic checkpoint BUB3 [Lecanosticta acicola]